jgi:hypothetical protein
MTTLKNLDDAIQLMRDAGHSHIPIPLELAEYLLTAAFFIRAQQGQPLPPIRARHRTPGDQTDVRNTRD